MKFRSVLATLSTALLFALGSSPSHAALNTAPQPQPSQGEVLELSEAETEHFLQLSVDEREEWVRVAGAQSVRTVEVTSSPTSSSIAPSAVCYHADFLFRERAPAGNVIYGVGYRFHWCSNNGTVYSKWLSGRYHEANWGYYLLKQTAYEHVFNGNQARGIYGAQFKIDYPPPGGVDNFCGVAIGYPNGSYSHRYSCNIYA